MSHDPRSAHTVDRRGFLGATAATLAAATVLSSKTAHAGKDGPRSDLAAAPPAGFTPHAAPGKIIKVSKSDSLQENKLWPKPDVARMVLERAMIELTGEGDVVKAFGRFIHKDDKVAIKVNGIAGQKGATMATNKELILPVVDSLLALGVPAANIWVYEQYPNFLAGTRINDKVLPGGVKSYTHNNGTTTMDEITVEGIATKFTKYATDATAIINISTIKDHGICGYTGMLKNMTHGSCINPHDFHAHLASPQIAHLYAQDVIKSRVRLNITDGFKVMYEGGPLDRRPDCRIPHDSVYVSTDPVALDTIHAMLVDKLRVDKGIKTLKDAHRDPSYIRIAAQLGLGIGDPNAIRMREVTLLGNDRGAGRRPDRRHERAQGGVFSRVTRALAAGDSPRARAWLCWRPPGPPPGVEAPMAEINAAASGTFKIGGEREVRRLGFGAMRITGSGIWGEPKDPAEARRVLARLPELGINFIDTADSYGPEVSERLIGEVLGASPHLTIATKGGLTRSGPDNWAPVGRPEYLRQCVHLSLRRLRTERISLWQLHRIDAKVPRDEQFGVIAEMQREGLVEHVGLSEVSVEEIEAAGKHFRVTTVQNLYNLANRQSEAVLDHCEQHQIGFIPWFPLAAGKLTAPGGPLASVAARLGATPSQVALAWVLRRSPVMLPIPGTGQVKHLEENTAAASLQLTPEDFAVLDEQGKKAWKEQSGGR
jgi:aryl-alcohol dehydrogenase-like predicted oxidoreductase/uncharacterized protein (DUF362 family)